MWHRMQLVAAAAGCFLLGSLLAPQLPSTFGQEKPKAPKWMHALNLGARKSNEPDFTSTTKQYGIEVFRDENNGNLIYITETGSIAVVRGQ